MKSQFFLFSVIIILLSGCKDSKKNIAKTDETITHYSTSLIEYSKLEGYELLPNLTPSKMLTLKITSQEQFNKYFNSKQLTTIDFKDHFIIALIGTKSKTETSFKLESIKDKMNTLELKYCINELDNPLKKAIYPYSIILINKKYNKNIHYLMN
ncbi:MAG: hypothetical protein LBI72_10920 [Flavobacteriaceae bacterium]|jgi:hypothetical protein|nr:hypothetical protein [Flavobacteriaceae bacterium]